MGLPSRPQRWTFRRAAQALERLCARAELQGATLQVLRHSYAATAAWMGLSELTIAGLLGHKVPEVTAR